MNPGEQGLNQGAGELKVAIDPSFEAFYLRHVAGWIRYAFAETGSRGAAEQIVDGVTAHIDKYWRDLQRGDRAAQHAWRVLKATIACWLDEHNTESAFVGATAFDRTARRVLARSGEDFAEMEESIGLFSAIYHLPERQRDAIILRFVLGYEYSDAARMMGVPEGAVRTNVCLAKKRIAKELGLPYLMKRTEA